MANRLRLGTGQGRHVGSSDEDRVLRFPSTHRTCFAWPAPTTCRARGVRKNCGRVASPSVNKSCSEGNWPWELIDVEPLLDGRATVLHYLGPHQLDVAPLRARFRVECDIDVVLEPVGNDLDGELSDGDAHDDDTGGGCGSCGCSDGGGCGSTPRRDASRPSTIRRACREWVRPNSHSGCSSCGISRLMAERSRARA